MPQNVLVRDSWMLTLTNRFSMSSSVNCLIAKSLSDVQADSIGPSFGEVLILLADIPATVVHIGYHHPFSIIIIIKMDLVLGVIPLNF